MKRIHQRLQGQDVHSSGIRQPERCTLLARETMKIMQSHQSWSSLRSSLMERLMKWSWRLTLRTHSALSRSWTYLFLRSQKESWKLSHHSTGATPRTSRYTDRQHVRTHTHTKRWRRSSKILNPPQQVAHARSAKIVSRHEPSVNHCTSRKLSGGEAVRDHQEHRAEKESDRPAEDQSGEQTRENAIWSQHI